MKKILSTVIALLAVAAMFPSQTLTETNPFSPAEEITAFAADETTFKSGDYTCVLKNGGVEIVKMNNKNFSGELVIPEKIEGVPVKFIRESAFESCQKITSVEFPSGIEYIGLKAFSNCTSLYTVTIPGSIKEIYNHAFEYCYYLTDFNLDTTSLEKMGQGVFMSCNRLKRVDLSANTKFIWSEDDVLFINRDGVKLLYWYPFEKPDESYSVPSYVDELEECSMDWTKYLKTLYIPKNVKKLGYYSLTDKACLTPIEMIVILNDDLKIQYHDGDESLDFAGTGIPQKTLVFANNGSAVEKYCEERKRKFYPLDVYSYGGSELTYDDSGSEVVITGCSESAEGVMIIPPTINGKFVGKIADGAFKNCSNITNVYIPYMVQEIGNEAFANCKNLKYVKLSNAIASKYSKIGNGAFYYCYNLEEAPLPKNITSIPEKAFYGCSHLTTVNIPEKVTSIGKSAFEGCSSVPAFNYVNNSESSQLTSIGEQAFRGCVSITDFWIPAGVTSIGDGAFMNCTGITAFNILGENKSFRVYNDNTLCSADGTRCIASIPSKIGEKYTVFSNVTEIGDGAFSQCKKLKELTILNPDCKIADSRNVFTNAGIGGKDPYRFEGIIYGYDDSTAQEYAEKYNITFVPIRTTVGSHAGYSLKNGLLTIKGYGETNDYSDTYSKYYSPFRNNTEITSVSIDDGITKIGNYLFSGCKSIGGEIDFPESVDTIGMGAFQGAAKLTGVNFSEGLTKIELWAFLDCPNLKSVTIPKSVTTIENYAFGFVDTGSDKEVVDGFIVYGYSGTAAQEYAEKYGLKFEALDIGDVNNDGQVNIADAVMLQKWILASPDAELANWKAADICQDNVINSFDLAAMKRMLISKK